MPSWTSTLSRETASADDAISYAAQEAGLPVDTPANASSRLHLTEFLVEGLLSQLNLILEILDPSMINDGFQQFMWSEEHYSSLVGN